jgi:spore germination cell wall hydrolase CwlJ-like protein
LFYHATYVNPFWTLSESKVAQIGKHIFYERAEGSWLAID